MAKIYDFLIDFFVTGVVNQFYTNQEELEMFFKSIPTEILDRMIAIEGRVAALESAKPKQHKPKTSIKRNAGLSYAILKHMKLDRNYTASVLAKELKEWPSDSFNPALSRLCRVGKVERVSYGVYRRSR